MRPIICLLIALLATPLAAEVADTPPEPRPEGRAQADPLPEARWDHLDRSDEWSRAALEALKSHGDPLVRIVPEDVATWCPGYTSATNVQRRAFWVGFLSALAKHESTYRPGAVGGGGRWYGLLQIKPATARLYGCRVGTGEALKDGAANLSCAIRIMARTVVRDGVISEGMKGVAADWGPFHSAAKREDMRAWVREQAYCALDASPRPTARPDQSSGDEEGYVLDDVATTVAKVRAAP